MAGVCPWCLLGGAQTPTEDEDAAEFSAPVASTVGGYDLLERIGRGGMGIVYRARQHSLGRTVAVKMVSAGEFASPETLRRFRLEAESAAKLQHPGIVAIHEVGEHDGLPFYSMDYIAGGRTLAGLIAEKPMPPHAAAACLEKVARAVQHAHEHGVLHRDLKPSNILLDEQGDPRVTDFGLARHLGTDSNLTLSRNILGSPAYMPPEQAGGRSAEAGPASDVYSLGAVLYHCLTGRPPFAGESVETVLMQVRETDPVPPRRLNPSLPRDLDTVVLKCLEKAPSRRYHSARALAEELGCFLRGEPVLARPLGFSGRLWRWVQRHPAAASFAALLVTALTAGFVLTLHVNRTLADGKRSVESALTEKSSALDGQTRALIDAIISRAEAATRVTGQAGQRTAALAAVRQAAGYTLTNDEKFRARNAALTALAMPEAVFIEKPQLPPPGDGTMALCDPAQHIYIHAASGGKIEARQVTDGKVVASHDLSPRKINGLLGIDETGKFLAFRYNNSRLGVLHLQLGMMPLQAEPWPGVADFRPCQVTFGQWNVVGKFGSVSSHLPLATIVVSWPDPDGSIVITDPISGFPWKRWRLPVAEGAETFDGPRWQALSFSPGGDYLAAADASCRSVVILKLPDGSVRSSHPMPSPVHSLGWPSSGGRVAIGLASGGVRIVDTFPSDELPEMKFPAIESHSRPVVNVDIGLSGVLSSSEDGTTKLWDRRSPDTLFDFPASGWRAGVDPGGLQAGPFVKGGMVGFVRYEPSLVFRTDGVWMRQEATGPHCVLPDGRGIALLHDEGLDFNATVRYGARNLIAFDAALCAVASPQSNWLLTGHAGKVCHLPVGWRDEQQARILPGKPTAILTDVKRVSALALSGDARLLAVADEDGGEVRTYPLDEPGRQCGPPLARINLTNPMACSMSPDGKWLAAGSAAPFAAGVWDAATGTPAVMFSPAAAVRNWRPVFSQDGRWLAVTGRSCHLFVAGTWEPGPVLDLPLNDADHHSGAFHCASGQPDRCLLAVVAGDREVHLIRLLAGPPAEANRLAVLRTPGDPFVSWPAFDTRGKLTVALPRAQMATWSLAEARKELRSLNLDW
jgi:WD40 repeat protein